MGDSSPAEPPVPADERSSHTADDADVVRSEEERSIGARTVEAGRIRIRTHIDTEHVERDEDRALEEAASHREPAMENDSGEVITYEDGSVSIPVFEEQLVVTKRVVVRERLVVRKTSRTVQERIETELRRERVEVDVDQEIADRVSGDAVAD